MTCVFVFPVGAVYVVGGFSAGGRVNSSEGLLASNPPDIPAATRSFPLVAVGCLLFICGGITNAGHTDVCYTLSIDDPEATWITAVSLSRAIHSHSGVVIGLNIWYVSASTLYDYNTVTGTTVEHAMPFTSAYDHCAVANNGHCYIAGVGSNKDEVWVNTFAGNASQWALVVTLPIRMWGPSCVVIENELFIQGGFRTTDLADSFAVDIKTNKYRQLANMTSPRTNARAIVLEGKPAVVGGKRGETYLSSIEVYDNTSNEWTLHELELQTARSYFGLVQL